MARGFLELLKKERELKMDIIPAYLKNLAVDCSRKKNEVTFFLKCECGNSIFEAQKLKTDFGKAERKRDEQYWKKFRFLPLFEFDICTDKKTGKNYMRGVTWFGIRVGKFFLDDTIPQDYTVVKIKCPDCGKEYVIFDSRVNGYEAVADFYDAKEQKPGHKTDTNVPPDGVQIPRFKNLCRSADRFQIKMKIVNDVPPEDFKTDFGEDAPEEDYANAFTRIVIYTVADGKARACVDEETA